jgi:cell division protein ZapE
MVATSNSAPRDLYRDGLNRQLFTPFIALIEERMEVHQLESAKDYRLEKLHGSDLYLTPAMRAPEPRWMRASACSPGASAASLRR